MYNLLNRKSQVDASSRLNPAGMYHFRDSLFKLEFFFLFGTFDSSSIYTILVIDSELGVLCGDTCSGLSYGVCLPFHKTI